MVTRPSTQAGHWFSEALLKAIMLLDSHPDYESLMVLPDFPGPRQAHRIQTGARRLGGTRALRRGWWRRAQRHLGGVKDAEPERPCGDVTFSLGPMRCLTPDEFLRWTRSVEPPISVAGRGGRSQRSLAGAATSHLGMAGNRVMTPVGGSRACTVSSWWISRSRLNRSRQSSRAA